MKNTILKFGLYATGTLVVLMSIAWSLFGDINYSIQEVLGYASMILAASFVYFGIRHYRDHVNDSQLTFMEGLKIGVLIITIPSVAFGAFDVFYTEFINPEFMDDYYNYYVENMKSTLEPAEFKVQLAKLESEKEMFQNPLFQFLLMGFTVFLIGLIGTVISSLILKKN